ncbi:MBOAT family protein [Roseomonas nepalensis]|uniref:Probable alginate O-acetylase AlgI n=1 Tax=Muricoccus nepalensis TaxID=1854500 RepID=A0A502FAR3_9PROT|nr:MBOAT family O-acyltransferase [Roseomonas nepalensis]TPG46411.1 MBOAT family protein [Roseomonas nepalensis]
MLFYEPLFLFVFFPAAFALTWRRRHSADRRLFVLLTASLLFYTWGEPLFVPVVLASSALDYALGPLVARRARWALALGLVANLAILVFYKYVGFLTDSLFAVLSLFGVPAVTGATLQVALPIGVSFIVFEKVTYLVDIWRGLSPPARAFRDYLTYVFFFPKLLAGPIIKYHEIDAQFHSPAPLAETSVFDGFTRFMLGVIKKVLIADSVAPMADAAFAIPSNQLSFASAWSGVLLFTVQIYVDFSAYSDMAIGLARMFGYQLSENFNRPYISCSITEFWRRWHISLTSWIREYLYIPLGGNRVGPWRRMTNLWICFLASGLWHGAAWTYVLWGAYNGLLLVLDRLVLLRLLDRMPQIIANLLTLVIVMVGWTIFRASSLPQLGAFFHAMTHPGQPGVVLHWENTTLLALAAGIAISLAPRLPYLDAVLSQVLARRSGRFMVEAFGAVLFAVALIKAVTDPFRPFLYFRF